MGQPAVAVLPLKSAAMIGVSVKATIVAAAKRLWATKSVATIFRRTEYLSIGAHQGSIGTSKPANRPAIIHQVGERTNSKMPCVA